MTEALHVIVTVKDPAKLDEIKALSERQGMTNVSALHGLGLLKGVIHPDLFDTISRINGVQSIERERQVKVPDPRSPIQ